MPAQGNGGGQFGMLSFADLNYRRTRPDFPHASGHDRERQSSRLDLDSLLLGVRILAAASPPERPFSSRIEAVILFTFHPSAGSKESAASLPHLFENSTVQQIEPLDRCSLWSRARL